MPHFLKLILVLVSLSFLPLAEAQTRGVPDGFSELAESLSPSVVNISTAQNIEIEDEGEP